MEMVMSNGFTELSVNELQEIDGGFPVGWVIAGIVALGLMVTSKGCSDAEHGK